MPLLFVIILKLQIVNKKGEEKFLMSDDYNFLLDEDFIRWRLLQTKELTDYWENIILGNPHLGENVKNAIDQFSALKINDEGLPEGERQELYNSVFTHIKRYRRRSLSRRIGLFAAVFIGILSVVLITLRVNNNSSESFSSYDEAIVGETLPESDIQIITGGNRINIAHNSHIGLSNDGVALVTDSAAVRKEILLAESALNRLVVPYGKRTNLTLSDGTQVSLNSGSQLDFPSEFTEDKREIRVNGEIFIDVAHNPKSPFVVHAQDMEIEVLGTSFNISAYQDDRKKTVVLVEGNVNIKSGGNTIELLPNEKIDITGGEITREPVDVSEYISWTRGVLQFDETPISEILKKIGRYYNVKFENSPEIKLNDLSCSGKLFLSNSLDSVMASVSLLSSTVFEKNDKLIHITKK